MALVSVKAYQYPSLRISMPPECNTAKDDSGALLSYCCCLIELVKVLMSFA